MSYEYLDNTEAGPIKLCREIGRVEEYDVTLDPPEKKRAMRLHRESMIIDFHNHPRVLPQNLQDVPTYFRSGRPVTGFHGIKKSGATACFYGMAGSFARRSSPVPGRFEDAVWELGMVLADMDHHPDTVMRGLKVKDIHEAKRLGKTAVFCHIEDASVIGKDLDKMDVLYGLGVRGLGLSYNQTSAIASGSLEKSDSGLSNFGQKVVQRMNQLGIVVDFSHSSDLTLRQGLEISEKRCCCTHSLARGVNDNPKGLSGELLDLMAEHNGLVGVEAVPNLISYKAEQSVFDLIDHIDYIIKRIGVDHVAIGTDTLFGDHVSYHKSVASILGPMLAHGFPADQLKYMENPGQLPNITRALVARGYSDEDIAKIMGGNVLSFLEDTIG